MSDICLQGRVVGKVQGVGFRQATVREASRLGISGWVRNQSDGSVAVLQGLSGRFVAQGFRGKDRGGASTELRRVRASAPWLYTR